MAKTTARNATTRPNNFPPTFQSREIYCVELATAVAGRNIIGLSRQSHQGDSKGGRTGCYFRGKYSQINFIRKRKNMALTIVRSLMR